MNDPTYTPHFLILAARLLLLRVIALPLSGMPAVYLAGEGRPVDRDAANDPNYPGDRA